MSDKIIEVKGLGKKYGDFVAVRDLDLNVGKSEIYGFLGPNGAGKTTTIMMLLGILDPTQGEISLFGGEGTGRDPAIRSKIGVVSEKQYLYPELTMMEYLQFFAELYRVKDKKKRIKELAERVQLGDVLNRRLGAFSRGMQQKVGIIRALLHDPELFVIDEPHAGLDPIGIKQVRDFLDEEKDKGRTIFVSSHVLSEVEKLCDRVGIINQGTLVAEDQMENLSSRLSDEVELMVELSDGKEEVYRALENLSFVSNVTRDGKKLELKISADGDYRKEISQAIIAAGDVPIDLEVKQMSLEEAFVTITSKNISLLTKGSGSSQESN